MPAVAHIIRRRQSRKRRRRRDSRRSTLWLTLLLFLPLLVALMPFLAGLGLSVWLYFQAASNLPNPQDSLSFDSAAGAARYYDRSGKTEIDRLNEPLSDERTWIRLDELPQYVVDATLLVEDPDFLAAPPSFDLLDTALQLWRYIIGLPQSPSDDITSELVRDAVLPLAETSGLDRRLLEIVLVAESKRRHTAESLLEWRLNSLFYGHGAFGIDAAARAYFGKSANDLSLAETAMLAKTADAPALNPFDMEQNSRARGADLLFEMLAAERIEKPQFDSASSSAVRILARKSDAGSIALEFVNYARAQAAAILDRLGHNGERMLARSGLRIVTSLDLDLQRHTKCALEAHLGRLSGRDERLSAACADSIVSTLPSLTIASPPTAGTVVTLDVATGQILSLVGEATAARHQPAVVLHPFVYMHAFQQRELTPASMVYDIPQSYPGRSLELIYTPTNPDGRFRGPLNLRDAMAAGLLPPVAQVANAAGMAPVIGAAQALGFNSLDVADAELQLLERGGNVSVLDTAYAYSVLAALGTMRGLPADAPESYRGRDPVAILEIADQDGNILWAYADSDSQARQTQIVEPSLAYLVNDILADGEARQTTLEDPLLALQLSRPVAVLDGPSADRRVSWTVGYTPYLVVAVHTGRYDEAGMTVEPAQRIGSAPVWQALTAYAHEQRALPPSTWQAPADIEEYLVCALSGLLPATTDHCPTRRELMPADSALRRDDLWQTLEINRSTGQLATVNTPEHLRQQVAYFVPPEAILDWWIENDRPLPPSSYSTDGAAPITKSVQFTAPDDYDYVGSSVEIAAAVNREGAQTWLLEYGIDVNPQGWQAIGEERPLDADGRISTTWQTALLSGIHTLRVTVTFADGSRATDTRLLTFDNTPPVIKLHRSGSTSSTATGPIFLQAEVSDNLTIERVEFYRDDNRLGVDFDWPYGIELDIGGVIDQTVRAVAYDQVGNRAESQLALSSEDT